MKRLIVRLPASLIALAAVLSLVACASTSNQPIPADLSPAKFFQTTQELVDKEYFDEALRYLDEFKSRNQDSQDIAIQDKLLEGEYLSAQILYKRGKLAEAKEAYTVLLHKYDGLPEKSVSPPAWIRILCAKMIETIEKKLAPNTPAAPAASPMATTTAPTMAPSTNP